LTVYPRNKPVPDTEITEWKRK